MKRTLVAVSMAGAMTITALLGLPGTAFAAVHHSMQTDDSDPGGKVEFWPDGDHVKVCDQEADGWAVQVDIWNYTEGNDDDDYVYGYQIGGKGKCQDLRASLGGKYDLEERDTFRFRVCLDKADTSPKYCDTSYWVNDNGQG